MEYSGIPDFLGRLKARGHALMAKWGQDILLEKNRTHKDLSSLSSQVAIACNGSGNGRWNRVRDGSRKRVQQVL